MKNMTVKELMNKKIDVELEIMKTVDQIIQKFQEETGIGVKSIEFVLTPQDTNSYMVTNSVVLLDLDSLLEFESFDKDEGDRSEDKKYMNLYSYILKTVRKPEQLLLFKDWK